MIWYDWLAMMKPRFSGLALAVVCLAGWLPLSAQAQSAAANRQVRTAQQSFDAAQARLNTAQQAWAKAQEDFAKALAAHQAASNKVLQARQTAAQQHGATLGMTAAMSERAAASHEINARRDTIEVELKTRSDYKAAEADTEAARKRLGELSDDKSLTEEQRQTLGSELAAKIRHPTEMRKQAEARDSEMQKATLRWQTAEKKILELQPQLRTAIDSDPAVTKAAQHEKQTATALEKARSGGIRAEQAVQTAQANLERQNQQLQATIARTRRYR